MTSRPHFIFWYKRNRNKDFCVDIAPAVGNMTTHSVPQTDVLWKYGWKRINISYFAVIDSINMILGTILIQATQRSREEADTRFSDWIIDFVLKPDELCSSVFLLFISEDNTENNRGVDCTGSCHPEPVRYLSNIKDTSSSEPCYILTFVEVYLNVDHTIIICCRQQYAMWISQCLWSHCFALMHLLIP